MPFDAAALAATPAVHYVGEAFRHMAARYAEPLSGEGARIHGGRFNPPDSFPALYLCTPRACVVAEFRRLAARQVIGLPGLLPRILYRYDLSLSRVLDLTSPTVAASLGVDEGQVTGADWHVPQLVGQAAHADRWQGIIARSATGVDQVLTVFPDHTPPEVIVARQIDAWHTPTDLR